MCASGQCAALDRLAMPGGGRTTMDTPPREARLGLRHNRLGLFESFFGLTFCRARSLNRQWNEARRGEPRREGKTARDQKHKNSHAAGALGTWGADRGVFSQREHHKFREVRRPACHLQNSGLNGRNQLYVIDHL
jgi:hypothetical protein